MSTVLLSGSHDATLPHVSPLNIITKPMPNTKVPEPRYYTASTANVKLHREDGKPLVFLFGMLMTDLEYDIRYLDAQIADDALGGVVKHATEEEIEAYHMKRDPRGTIREKVKGELMNDPALRAELEAKIRAEMAAASVAPGSLEAAKIDAAKLAGTETAADKLKRLAEGIESGKIVKAAGATVVMTSGPAPIKPVSSADIAGVAPVSGQ